VLCSFARFCVIHVIFGLSLVFIYVTPAFEQFSICLYLIFLSLLCSLTFGLCNLCSGLVVSASFMLCYEHVACFAGFVESVSPKDFHSCVYPKA
jgi:hypothetical protein